jgi:multiple sugar transport system substrate-binding protein
VAGAAGSACAPAGGPRPVTVSVSAVGDEGRVVRRQLARFTREHPDIAVDLRVTPDAADQRHQLYVQWLNGRAAEPDVLQIDTIWTAEFAAAGWILPLDRFAPDASAFFPAAVEANRWRGRLYAIPWFLDVGLLYWRTDAVEDAPATLAELQAAAQSAIQSGATSTGLVWQGARYEGLVTVFIEHLGAFGGSILDDDGAVAVDAPEAVRALTFMRDAIWRDGWVPPSALAWQEEQTRFAFQNGQAAFMRNWPYAWGLLQDGARSKVAGRVAIAPFPAGAGGSPTAALGGAQLALNRYSTDPARAWTLVEFLTAPEQMLERARDASQLPSRPALYDGPDLAEAIRMPAEDLRRAIEAAEPRPVTPVYSELSDILQLRLHRALSRQQEPEPALQDAAQEIRALLRRSGLEGAE